MKRFILMIVTLTLCVGAWAIPARRGGIVLTDANGNEKTVFLHGNEHFHYMTDEQGRWLDEKTLVPMSEAEKEHLQQAGETRQRKVRRAMQQKAGIGDMVTPCVIEAVIASTIPKQWNIGTCIIILSAVERSMQSPIALPLLTTL